MDIYQSLKQHNLLDYVHMCGCCDMELLKYYEQNDIIEELEKNYAAVAEEMYALHDMSELQEEEIIEPEIEEQKVIKADEKSMEGDEELEEMEEEYEEEMEGTEEFDLMSKKTEKAPAIKKKPREIEYVKGLDELLASIRKTGILHRKDKELLLAGINNKHTSTAVIEYILLDEPYFTSPSVSEDLGGMDVESIETIKTVTTKSAHQSDEELTSGDFPEDKLGYNEAFRKKWHLPPDDVPKYYPNEYNLYCEKLPIKEQRFKKEQHDCKENQSYTDDKTFCKVFKEIFNKKKFVKEEKEWEQMMNRAAYYWRNEEDIKEENSEIEKLNVEVVDSGQGTVQETAEEQEAPTSKVPVEERKEDEEIDEFEKGIEFQDDNVFSRVESEELNMMKEADDDQTVGETDASDSESEINKEEIEELPEHEEHSEPEVEEVHEEKKKSKTIDKQDEHATAEKLLNRANLLKKDLYKYLLDGMINEVSPHLECQGQHSEYKKVHRDLITKKEHTKLLCIPPGDVAWAYERILIDRAKKRTAERSERWYPRNTTGLGCGKKRIFYPFSEKCLQYEYIKNFTTEIEAPLKKENIQSNQ